MSDTPSGPPRKKKLLAATPAATRAPDPAPEAEPAPAPAGRVSREMGVTKEGLKTGAELVKEEDTQSFMQDFWANAGKNADGSAKTWEDLNETEREELAQKGIDRKFYSDSVDSTQTQVKSSDFGSKDFDKLRELDRAYVHNKGRKYYNGWSEGKNVVLLYKDEKGRKKKEKVPYDFYFFIHDDEKQKLPPEKWRWMKDKGLFDKLVRDERFPHYWRIYVEYVDERKHGLGLTRREREAQQGKSGKRGGKFQGEDAQRRTYALLGERGRPIKFRDDPKWDSPLQKLTRFLQKYEIEICEADLTLKQRWVTDFDIEIEDSYRELYFDLETDDTIGGFEHKEENYILSIGWKNNSKIGEKDGQEVTEEGVYLSREASDEGEAEILRKFRTEILDRHDVLIAWNGWNFDFPVIIGRYEYHQFRFEEYAEEWERTAKRLARSDPEGAAAAAENAAYWWAEAKVFTIDWRYWLFNDLLPVFKRHYIRAASAATSFSLDNIGKNVLKMRKIDWRIQYREKHPDDPEPAKKIIELFHKDPDLLVEYNAYDVHILYNLEKFTGFAKMEQTFCRIGNCFANDFNISTKIDGLMLKKGYKEGQHFPTRFLRGEVEQYTGAHVFDPVKGVHHYVCAFDFKSLYPSMMTAFNISPETWVPRHERKKHVHPHPEGGCQPGCIPEMYFDDAGKKQLREGTCTGYHPGLIHCPLSYETFLRTQQGYIPQMFKETLFKRKKYTDLQKTENVGSDMFLLYYRLAYSFKRLGLSFYGELGNARSRYYFPSVAESVTLSGQYFIRETAKLAVDPRFEYRPLYGDTDSIYISLMSDAEADSIMQTAKAEGRDPIDALLTALDNRGKDFVAFCQNYYHTDMLVQWNFNPTWDIIELEFEDIYDIIFFVSKKRYAGRMLGHKGQRSNTVEIKGLEAMRSDNVELTRHLQRKVLHAILKQRRGGEWVRRYIQDYKDRFFGKRPWTRGFNIEELAITKSISKNPEDYASTPLHVRLAAVIKEHGREFYVGMKIPHIVTDNEAQVETGEYLKNGKAKTKKQPAGCMLDDWEPEMGYDAAYYWDRVVYPATMRVLEICFPDYDWPAFLNETSGKRERTLKQLSNWLRDPERRAKAIEIIKANKNGMLTPEMVEQLRAVAREKLLLKPVKKPRKSRNASA